MDLLFANCAHGPLELVLEFMGQDRQVCLALVCAEALEAVSQTRVGLTARRDTLYFLSTESLCTFAADALGLLEVKDVCTLAAKHGHLAALKVLRGKGCEWDKNTCAAAAKGGHLDVLKWLRLPNKPEGQCEWGVSTCWAAAKGGHLDVLKWLRLPNKVEGQCEWSEDMCSNNASGPNAPSIRAWISSQAD